MESLLAHPELEITARVIISTCPYPVSLVRPSHFLTPIFFSFLTKITSKQGMYWLIRRIQLALVMSRLITTDLATQTYWALLFKQGKVRHRPCVRDGSARRPYQSSQGRIKAWHECSTLRLGRVDCPATSLGRMYESTTVRCSQSEYHEFL